MGDIQCLLPSYCITNRIKDDLAVQQFNSPKVPHPGAGFACRLQQGRGYGHPPWTCRTERPTQMHRHSRVGVRFPINRFQKPSFISCKCPTEVRGLLVQRRTQRPIVSAPTAEKVHYSLKPDGNGLTPDGRRASFPSPLRASRWQLLAAADIRNNFSSCGSFCSVWTAART